MRWPSLVLGLVVLTAACGRTEPHGAPAKPVETLCQAVMTEPQVKEHAVFPIGPCLDVTFEPGAEENAAGLHAALAAWAAAPGTWLCFNTLREAAQPGDRAVHVHVAGDTGSALSLSEVKYEGRELLRAEVTFSLDFAFTHAMYLHVAGQLLGFQRTAGVDSVLNAVTPDDVLPMLTSADLQSVAAVYPACR